MRVFVEGILYINILIKPTKHSVLILVDFRATINMIFNQFI